MVSAADASQISLIPRVTGALTPGTSTPVLPAPANLLDNLTGPIVLRVDIFAHMDLNVEPRPGDLGFAAMAFNIELQGDGLNRDVAPASGGFVANNPQIDHDGDGDLEDSTPRVPTFFFIGDDGQDKNNLRDILAAGFVAQSDFGPPASDSRRRLFLDSESRIGRVFVRWDGNPDGGNPSFVRIFGDDIQFATYDAAGQSNSSTGPAIGGTIELGHIVPEPSTSRGFRRKSGSEGQEARTGKGFWGQKSERLGSIDTLRASGAGDSQSGDEQGRERNRCTGRFWTAKPEGAQRAGGDTDYLAGLITPQAIADHQSEQTLEIDAPGAGARATW
jgi:hypothetical protein